MAEQLDPRHAAVVVIDMQRGAFEGDSERSRLLRGSGIDLFPYAVSNKQGFAEFHVTEVDFDEDKPNLGTSSLLVHPALKIKHTVTVPTRRIDEFLLSNYPGARRIGLWIDAEGSEFEIIEGMARIKDRVVALHVETAFSPVHPGQKLYGDVQRLLKSLGFVPVCMNTSMDGLSPRGDGLRWGSWIVAIEARSRWGRP